MRLFACLTLTLSLAISLVSPSLGHEHLGRRHHVHRQADLARRDPGEITLHKRFDNARFTYFQVGLGSCGTNSQSTDFVVALDASQYDSGSYCYQMITITASGKTTQAQIVDRCTGCPPDGLDFSQGLFEFFADVSVGVLYGTWNFGSGGSAPSPSPTPSPSPQPSTTSVNIPVTTYLPSPTTSTSQPPPSTTATSASSTTHSSSSGFTTASSSTSSLVPTQTTTNAVTESAAPGGTANSSVLSDVNLSIVLIGQFLVDSSSMQ